MSYDELIVDQTYNAYELLDAATGTLSRTILGPIDPVTGEPTSSVTESLQTLFKFGPTSIKALGFKFGDGLVKGGELEIIIPAKGLGFFPEAGYSITAKGAAYVIVQVAPNYGPGGAETEFAMLVKR